MIENFIDEEINNLEENNLMRRLRTVSSSQGAIITIEGKKVLNFCSNNYLGLADDFRLKEAACQSIEEDGLGAGASRLVCGNMEAHGRLERKLAEFKSEESCLVFSTGYMANVGIISSLFSRNDIIFSDRLNHASIVDGILLSGAKYRRYPHNNMQALERMLSQEDAKAKKRAIITDSVFSMDGDIAPLDEIVKLAQKYNCMVMIDEAHALGVMGQKGRGLAEYFSVEDKIDIKMGTLSKAVGSFGAYCCGSKKLIDLLMNKARSFIYTTAMPPAIASAAYCGIEIIEQDATLRTRLWENAHFLNEELSHLGFSLINTQTPIIPILVKNSNLAVEFSNKLLKEGIFISAIRPPTVPNNSARLRLTVMATHQRKELQYLLEKIKVIGKSLGIIN